MKGEFYGAPLKLSYVFNFRLLNITSRHASVPFAIIPVSICCKLRVSPAITYFSFELLLG